MDKRFDVIIIGSGAGGGTIARCLAPSGKSILILERGDWLKREAKNWDAVAVFEKNRYISPDTWYDRDGRPFQPQVHYFVGGATKLFGAALYRLRERDFAELHHHDGISPAWPISYQDLEPYYARAEEMYHVHGLRGRDPTEPPLCDHVERGQHGVQYLYSLSDLRRLSLPGARQIRRGNCGRPTRP